MEQRRTIFLNSKDRSSGNYNNFTIDTNIQDPFFSLNENEELYVLPTRFSVLNDFNNINIYNRTFDLLVEDFATSNITTYTITLDDGVYTDYTLQTEVQDKINALLSTSIADLSCVISFNTESLKYSFQFDSSAGDWFDNNELRFDFSGKETSPATLLGFLDGEYIPNTTTSASATFVSPNAVNMVFQPEIEIYCSLVSKNYRSNGEAVIPSQILLSINQGAKGSFIEFENQSDIYKTESISQFQTINIRYLDNLQRPILFNSDSRLSLTFIKVNNQDNSTEMLKNLEKLISMTELSLLMNSQK